MSKEYLLAHEIWVLTTYNLQLS